MRRTTIFAALACLLLTVGCSYGGHTSDEGDVVTFGAGTVVANTPQEETTDPIIVLDSMPPGGEPVRVRHIGNYAEVFNDSNVVHWTDGEKIGIQPLTDLRSFWTLERPLVKVESCRDYYLEPLTHSSPYLVEEASELLHEIGSRFNDSLLARGGGDYRIKVTSVLRTPASVKKLRRVHRNAVDSSTHLLATTFDISYAQFAASSDKTPRRVDDLKGILAEVLYDLRREGRCWVKYERRQPCFHITTRPKGSEPPVDSPTKE